MRAAVACAAHQRACRLSGFQHRGSSNSSMPVAALLHAPASAAALRRQPLLPGLSGASSRARGRLHVTAAVKMRKGKQVLCNKTLKAKEGSEAQVAELCRGVAEWSQTRMADRGSGVLAFQFSEDDFDKGVFHFMELYASQTAMVEHNSNDQIRQLVQQLHQHLDGPLGMVLYEYDNGKIGPASMEGEVKGEGGLDDATGANKYGGGASMRQTSSVVDLTGIREEDDEEKGVWGLKGLQFKLPSWVVGRDKK